MVSSAEAEAARLMERGHAANERGEYDVAYRCFSQSDALRSRPAARLSAANMALKLGDAAGAMETYLSLLKEGEMTENGRQREVLLRKIREASGMAREAAPAAK